MIDQKFAIIAHLDVLSALDGEAKCRLVLVDLEAGRHAGDLCVAAREWEKRRNVFSIPTSDLTVSVEVSPQVSPAGAEYSPAGDQPLPSPPVEGPAEPGDRLSPSPQGSSAPVADAPPRSSAADDRRAGLVERYRKLTDDQKRYYTAHKPDVNDLDAVEAAIAALEFKPKPLPASKTLARAQERMAADAERVCKSCGAAIRWVVTEAGKKMPLDPEPRDDGNVHIYDRVAYVLDPNGQAIIEHRAEGDKLYVSHFTTCPQADEHRKRSPQKPAEGAAVDDADFDVLQKRYASLDDASRSWFGQLIVEADDAGVDFKAQGHRTVRRYELYRGLIGLGEYFEANPTPNTDEALRSLVHEASGFDDSVMFANVTPGHALGSLDATQARTFSHLVDVYVSPLITT